MTNKLPEAGKKYRPKNYKHPYVVEVLPIISVRDEIFGTVKEYGIEIFNDIYKPLEDNSQEEDFFYAAVGKFIQIIKRNLTISANLLNFTSSLV